jgi:hypothetical protein
MPDRRRVSDRSLRSGGGLLSHCETRNSDAGQNDCNLAFITVSDRLDRVTRRQPELSNQTTTKGAGGQIPLIRMAAFRLDCAGGISRVLKALAFLGPLPQIVQCTIQSARVEAPGWRQSVLHLPPTGSKPIELHQTARRDRASQRGRRHENSANRPTF